MFTGLVESTGIVVSLEEVGAQARLRLRIPFVSELATGDSVAINGCCLTVVTIEPEAVAFDLLAQTLHVTSLGELRPGAKVNLERALRASDRLGGHFVQGHVDACAEIIDYSLHGQDHRLEVSLPDSIRSLCIDKGSLAIDGISLTIAELRETSAVIWIIPHTHQDTNLCEARVGKKVNLEADLLAKYVRNLLPSSEVSG